MLESTVTSKGQTTLPKDVRDAMGLKPGDKLSYVPVRGGYLVRKPMRLEDLAGCLAHDGPPVSLDEIDEAIADGAAGSGMAGLEE